METTAAIASAIQQADLTSKISTQVAVKAKEVVEQQGEAAISLLKSAAEVGKNVNREQSRIEGRGGNVDVRG